MAGVIVGRHVRSSNDISYLVLVRERSRPREMFHFAQVDFYSERLLGEAWNSGAYPASQT